MNQRPSSSLWNRWHACALGTVLLLAGCGGAEASSEPVRFSEDGLSLFHPSSWNGRSSINSQAEEPGVVQEVSFGMTVGHSPSHVTICRMESRAAAEALFHASKTAPNKELTLDETLGDLRWATVISSSKLFDDGAELNVIWKSYVHHRGDTWFYVWVQSVHSKVVETGEVITEALGQEELQLVFDSIAYSPVE